MDAYLGHSSLNPELSQFIVPKFFWPSSGTFQHHHQLSASEDTASCLLGRLDTHQRASLCGQLEFVSRTSLIEHTHTRRPGRCILYGRRSRRRRSTASHLHIPFEPGEFFIREVRCSSLKLVQELYLLLCHLLMKFFRRPLRAAALAQGNPRDPTLSVMNEPRAPRDSYGHVMV